MDSSHVTSFGKMLFLCREIPSSLTCVLWDLKRSQYCWRPWSVKSSSERKEGKKGMLCCRWRYSHVLWTPALRCHLLSRSSTWESCRWEKCWVKSKRLIHLGPGLQCPSPWGWSAQWGQGLLCSYSSGPGSQPTRPRAGEPVCSHSEIYFKA